MKEKNQKSPNPNEISAQIATATPEDIMLANTRIVRAVITSILSKAINNVMYAEDLMVATVCSINSICPFFDNVFFVGN
jgi:hypothetical protein